MVVSSALPPGWSVPPREEWLPCRGEPLLVAGEGNSHDVVPLVWLVAAHGGAGVSTLCQWWDFVGDAGRMWPDKDTYPAACLVAKATMESLGACDKQVRSVVAGATACLFFGCGDCGSSSEASSQGAASCVIAGGDGGVCGRSGVADSLLCWLGGGGDR